MIAMTTYRFLYAKVMNESVLAASAVILKHLTSMVVLSIETNATYQCTHFALDTLVNIGARIDLTARKRLPGFHFAEEAGRITDPYGKQLMELRLSHHWSQASTGDYSAAVFVLMTCLYRTIVHGALGDRHFTLRAMELLSKVASNPDNALHLSHCPDELLSCLCELVCANTTFAEPLVQDICHISG
jgi:hypothetical protein